ncbi:MAG: hypothetical protein M3N53_00425 [Actinomycetota bacterium]|nr:hypothetical protein [Actinomycetota bacterium]
MKKLALCITLIASIAAPAAAFPGGEVTFDTDFARYREGKIVTLTLHNGTGETITMENPWTIEDRRDGQTESVYTWPDEELVLAPGDDRVWRWEQNGGSCYGQCQSVQYGEPVGPGRYIGIASTSAGDFAAPFEIGEFFTLGFTSRPDTKFIVYVNTPAEVTQMREQAAAAPEDKQIVSGIVRRGKRYNLLTPATEKRGDKPEWNFTMGPGSIVLGEAFIEVCDASPYYVQEHRSEWLGDRWCPWSSYVEKVGR